MTILAAAGPLYKMLVGTILSHCLIKYQTTYVMYVPTISPCSVRFCQLWNLDKCGYVLNFQVHALTIMAFWWRNILLLYNDLKV